MKSKFIIRISTKLWIIIFFLITFLTIFVFGFFNYLIDPLWTFDNKNKFNNIQIGFNERQQKSNYIYFNNLNKFDGILLGSSRSTFINQNDFNNMNIYNYASNSMLPREYDRYIDFMKESSNSELKYIIIGIDFFGSNKLANAQFEKPDFYISNTKSFFYRYKMLFSQDILKQSKKIFKKYLKKDRTGITYNRLNVKNQTKVTELERSIRYRLSFDRHINDLSNEKYLYDYNYIKIMKKIKNKNKNSKFIIFTLPISSGLQVAIMKDAKRFKDYERWLNETITIFGEIHHFMLINEVTKNLQNYPDDDHFYPYIGTLVANSLSGKENSNIPKLFQIILTKQNIKKYLNDFKLEINKYSDD